MPGEMVEIGGNVVAILIANVKAKCSSEPSLDELAAKVAVAVIPIDVDDIADPRLPVSRGVGRGPFPLCTCSSGQRTH